MSVNTPFGAYGEGRGRRPGYRDIVGVWRMSRQHCSVAFTNRRGASCGVDYVYVCTRIKG